KTGHGILRIKLKDSENKIEKPTADLRPALWAHSVSRRNKDVW
ncbi:4770_t:CDS:1, partial [Gigaspora rosea]